MFLYIAAREAGLACTSLHATPSHGPHADPEVNPTVTTSHYTKQTLEISWKAWWDIFDDLTGFRDIFGMKT